MFAKAGVVPGCSRLLARCLLRQDLCQVVVLSWHGNRVIACGLGVGYKGCSIGGSMTTKNVNVNGSILFKLPNPPQGAL